MLTDPPIRVCCGQRHLFGPICPDNKVMCCLCFDRFDINELSIDDEGNIWDVCQECREREEDELENRNQFG